MKLRADFIKVVMLSIFSLSLIGSTICVTANDNPVQLFESANNSYMEQDYMAAIEQYEKLIALDKVSHEVYFNLGNSYYKTGSITQAIINYERAKRLKPSDPDIAYNLQMAYMSTIDKIEPLPKVFYEEWWDHFVNEGVVDQRAKLAVILLWLALILSGVYLFANKPFIRRIMFFSSLIILFTGLFTVYLTILQQEHLNNNKAAIIFSQSAYVKSSPDPKSSNLFMLHSGTRIDVLDELQGWKKIRIANGNEGWVTTESIEII